MRVIVLDVIFTKQNIVT